MLAFLYIKRTLNLYWTPLEVFWRFVLIMYVYSVWNFSYFFSINGWNFCVWRYGTAQYNIYSFVLRFKNIQRLLLIAFYRRVLFVSFFEVYIINRIIFYILAYTIYTYIVYSDYKFKNIELHNIKNRQCPKQLYI